MVMPVMRRPPDRAALDGGGSKHRERELHAARGLERAVGEVAVVEARDREHAQHVQANRRGHGHGAHADPDDAEAGEVHSSEWHDPCPVHAIGALAAGIRWRGSRIEPARQRLPCARGCVAGSTSTHCAVGRSHAGHVSCWRSLPAPPGRPSRQAAEPAGRGRCCAGRARSRGTPGRTPGRRYVRPGAARRRNAWRHRPRPRSSCSGRARRRTTARAGWRACSARQAGSRPRRVQAFSVMPSSSSTVNERWYQRLSATFWPGPKPS